MGLDLETTDVPIVKPSQITLARRLQSFVWRVTVGGEAMICKASTDVFEHAIDAELAVYLNDQISRRGVEGPHVERRTLNPLPSTEFLAPVVSNIGYSLGIVQSHKGVIGLLLDYIPHKHHSLRTLLAGIEAGTLAASERPGPQTQVGDPDP
jgi:hypothetical protein